MESSLAQIPNPAPTKNVGPTLDGNTSGSSRKLNIPPYWQDVTSEKSGRTLMIIGAPRPGRVDPLRPLRSDKELIEQALRDNLGLTLETILAEAKHHGWDLDPAGVQLPPDTNPRRQP